MEEKRSLRNIRIKVFNIGWWFYVVLTILFLFLITLLSSGMDRDTKLKMILYLSIFEYILLRFYKYSLMDIRDDYNWYNEWPCYLCNQSTLLCILSALIDHQGIMSYCVTVGTIGALLAIFMPDRYNRDQLLFSRQAFGFYGYHGMLVVTCLSFYTTGVYEPRPIHALWGMGVTFVLAVIAHIINVILRKSGLNPKANYVYTCEPDNFIFEKLYKIVPIRLVYLIPVMLGFGMISYIALSIM